MKADDNSSIKFILIFYIDDKNQTIVYISLLGLKKNFSNCNNNNCIFFNTLLVQFFYSLVCFRCCYLVLSTFCCDNAEGDQ